MFSKNIKSTPIVAMLLVMVLGSVVLYADCDKMALIAKEGYLISNINDPDGDTENDFDDPVDFFDYIRERSCEEGDDAIDVEYLGDIIKVNRDGYGFSYYKESSLNVPCNPDNFYTSTNQAWYSMGQDIFYYRGLEYDYENFEYTVYNEPLDIAESLIMNLENVNHSDDYPDLIDNNDCEAVILLGHARQGSTGDGSHPFKFEWNGRTYTFMHNGWIYSTSYKQAILNYLSGLDMGGSDDWFDTYNLNWIDPESNWYNPSSPYYHDIGETIDSEIFFHYLMKFIIENDGNMIAGINEAVTQNYIGGNEVYVDIEDRLRTPDLYGDYWRDVVNFVISDGENLYVFRNSPSVDSYHELSYKDNGSFYSVKTLDPRGGELIDQFDLIKISRDEDPVVYHDFLDIDYKTFSSGYNWTSFPRLDRNETINEEVDIVPILGTIEPNNFNYLDFDAYGQNDLEYENFVWNPGDYDIKSTALYKIKIDPDEERALEVEGTRMEYNYSLADPLAAYDYHWLGYWLPEPQNIEDAFGDLWESVRSVSAEDWYWFDGLPERNGEPVQKVKSWETEGKTMEYGKGYVVKFYDEISNFQWTRSGVLEEPERKEKSEDFNYAEKAEYEVIDVVGIDSAITEIGVYEDDFCVGAVVVKDSCEQILVYSDNANRDPVPFTFEITTGRGSSIPIQNYSTLNLRTGKYEETPVISGRQEFSVIKFGKQEEQENNIPLPILLGNYPNPFNPTTTISFSLPTEQKIELTIFNIKGQKVKTLYSGTADKGNHSIVWEGRDMNNKSVSSGLYFYKLRTSFNVLSRKMIMIK